MIEINPQYETIFNTQNIDDDCDKIAQEISTVGEQIAEVLKVGLYKQAVTMYLQLLKSMYDTYLSLVIPLSSSAVFILQTSDIRHQ